MTNPGDPRLIDHPGTDTLVVRGVVAMDDLRGFFDRSFTALSAVLSERGVAPTGPAFAFYAEPPGSTCELEVGYPLDTPVAAAGDVVASRLPGGRVATLVHEGGYDGLDASWGRLVAWVRAEGLQQQAGLWEVYLTEPTPEGDPAQNRTGLFIPVA